MNAMTCRHCGASAFSQEGNILKCKYCYTTYHAERESKMLDRIREILIDEIKEERVANLRQQLYEKIHQDPPDSAAIVDVCREIRGFIAEDIVARFYEAANAGNSKAFAEFLNVIDVKENYAFIESFIKYSVGKLDSQLILSVGNLIERASQAKVIEVSKYNELQTFFESEAKKVESDVYNPKVTRDFFVMYSSKDMDEVMKLVSFLESQETTCFVALRNIQHGCGSREQYISLIETAIEYCNCIVFVSSTNSRRNKCEALSVEMDYIRRCDKQNAPHEFRNEYYHKIPYKYKKRRIEYLIEMYDGSNVEGERMTKEFFFGLEYVKGDPGEVLHRYFNPGSTSTAASSSSASAQKPKKNAKLDEAIRAFESKSYEDAVDLFEEAALDGDSRAQCNLGYCYEMGYGIDRDVKKAVKWYQRAAEQDNARAQYNLGVCYQAGLGVERDPDRAEEYFNQAAKNGDPKAKEWLKSN